MSSLQDGDGYYIVRMRSVYAGIQNDASAYFTVCVVCMSHRSQRMLECVHESQCAYECRLCRMVNGITLCVCVVCTQAYKNTSLGLIVCVSERKRGAIHCDTNVIHAM